MKHFTLLMLLCSISLIGFSREYFLKTKSREGHVALFRQVELLARQDSAEYVLKIERAFLTLTDLGLDRIYLLDLPHKTSEATLRKISGLQGVEYLELVPMHKLDYTPNDYNGSVMWNLNKIDALKAWDLARGGAGVVIGLVDDGMDTAHPDLQPALWHNPNEIKGNGIDDDLNGYVDDFFGWDVADNDNNPCVVSSDNLTHGTHCAGIAGARTDNNKGISSIGFDIRIMPLKCGKKTGGGALYNPYRGVEYAIQNGARIISMSWGGGNYSATYQTLFDVAFKKNIVCVAAAGNDGDSFLHYPAAYNHVIAVGNTTSSDAIHSSSNYGSWVDVMAPGSSIYSTLPGNNYGYKTGTSMACPLVSGLCALMVSRNTSLTNTQVENCLKSNCDNIDAQNKSYIGQLGSGRINAYKALKCVKPITAFFSSSKTYVCTGDTMRYYDQSSPSPSSWLWNFQGGTPSISSAQNPIVKYTTNGVYKVQLIVTKGTDKDTIVMFNYVTVGKPTAVFSGIQTINKGDFGTIKADLTGAAPWTLVYTDGKKNDTLKNILNTPYFILKLPDSTKVYKPLAVYSGNCSGTVKDSTKIIVNQNISTVCDSSLRFHLTFGGSGDDQAYDMATFNDTDIYIAGYTKSRGAGAEDAFVAKLNSKGQIVWYKTFGNAYFDLFYGITVDDKGNIYLSGWYFANSSSSDKMMLYIKLDKNGNIKWEKQLNGTSIEFMKACILSKFSPYMYFTGPVVSNSYGGEDFLLMKCDTNGNFIWSKKYGTSTYQDRPSELVEDEKGNIYMVGGANGDYLLIKTDSAGSLIYSKFYALSGGYIENLHSITKINSSLYMTGYSGNPGGTSREVVVLKTDLGGNLLWTKKYAMSSPGLMNSFAEIKSKDNMLFVSWSLDINGNDGFLMNLDTNGNILKYGSIGATGSQNINSISVLSDNSLVYVGTEVISGDNEIMLGKVNCKLKNQCYNSGTALSATNISLTTTNFSILNGSISLTRTSSAASGAYTVGTNVLCASKNNIIVPKSCRLNADFKVAANCAGDTSQFTNLSIDSNGFNINGWFWDFGDGKILSGSGNPKHLYTKGGQYIAKLIVSSTGSGKTCSDTITHQLNVSDSLKIFQMPGDVLMCRGDSIQVSQPFAHCGTGPYYYTWSPSAGVSDVTLGQPYFFPKVTTLYSVTMKDYNGKTSRSASFKIIVDNSCCKSKARFQADKQDICINDTVRFINTSTYDKGSYYFEWKFTGANISTYTGANPPPVVFNSSGKKSVQLILSDICSNDTLILPLYIYKLPSADAGRDTFTCRKDTLHIGSEAFDRNIYTWTPPTGLDDPNSSSPVAIVNSSIVYKVTVTDEHGCVNKDSVKILLIPSKLFIANDTSICSTDSVKLQISAPGAYKWSTGQTSKSIYAKNPGTYWGQVTTQCIAIDTVKISTKPSPVFSIGPDTFYCEGNTLKLSASVAGTYLWSTGKTTGSIDITQPGIYWLKVSSGGCSTTDSVVVAKKPKPVFDLGPIKVICKDSVQIGPSVSYSNSSFQWNTGSSKESIKVKTAGAYSLRISDQNNCTYSDTVLVRQGLIPGVQVQDVYKCTGINYLLTLPQVSGQVYFWSDSSTGPFKSFKLPGKYWVRASTECGDTQAYFMVTDSSCECDVFVPNAFSPNGDGKNEIFKIIAGCHLTEYRMRVFTRWGEEVFESDDVATGWDGNYKNTIAPLGMYMYMLEFRKNLPSYTQYVYLNGMIMLMQ